MHVRGRRLRNELKFYIHTYEYVALRSRVSAIMMMDQNSVDSEGYGIRSLYFDGLQDPALYDKNDGIFQRDKYRIRIYNGSDLSIRLERKSKFGGYVCKDSAELTRAEYEQILARDTAFLSDRKEDLLRDFQRAIDHHAFRPAVIVDYMREAYVYEEGNVRITFDKRLAAGVNAYDLFDQNLVLEEALSAPLTIMEVKFDHFLPETARRIIQSDTQVRSAISKYVICREVGFKHFKP